MRFLKALLVASLYCLGTVLSMENGLWFTPNTNGWVKHSKANPQQEVRLTLAVKQNNLEIVDRLFWELSNPKSDQFGKWLSYEELGDLVKNPSATAAVERFLFTNAINNFDTTDHGTYVSVTMKVGDAEKLFKASFYNYRHASSESDIVKTDQYAVPVELRDSVTHVAHIGYFPNPIQFSRRRVAINRDSSHANAADTVTPAVLQKVYNIQNTVTKNKQTTQAVFEIDQDFSNADLETFEKNYGLQTHDLKNVVGLNTESNCFRGIQYDQCVESNLDVQYIMGIAQGAETTFWNMRFDSNDPFLDWAVAVSDTATPPLVHSISWGGYEYNGDNDDATFNTEMQKLGVRGVTVMVASGDDGVGNFGAANDATQCGYFPSFPATSPYVTAVGATQGPESGKPEIACGSTTGGIITSGGGFSDLFDAPSYQQAAISSYFKNLGSQPATGYATKGRGIPDVSVLGFNYEMLVGGKVIPVSGTSASSPAFAGMVSLINDYRLQNGKSSLGFLNQALYSLGESAFNDITVGNNSCTVNPNICCTQGFVAAPGWDPVTGLGSPKFDVLLQKLGSL